jgi:hypothetical protein
MTTLGLPNLWLGSPQWQHASWAVRGLQAHLWMLAASRTPAGTLPDDDKWLRKALELPTPAAAGRARAAVLEAAAALPAPGARRKKASKAPPVVGDDVQSAPLDWTTAHARVLDALLTGQVDEELQDAQQDAWLDHLWVNHWKAQLFEGWMVIDDELIGSHPHLARARGGWFHPLAEALSKGPVESPDAKRAPKAPKAKVVAGAPVMAFPFSKGAVLTPAAEEHLSPWWGTMDEARLLQIWAVPLSKEDSSEMWKTGVSDLATHGKSEEIARRFLSRMVKTHGEKAVHQALQQLARRITPPIDSFSFLQGLLNQKNELDGTVGEQKARSQRAKVAL